VIDYDNNSNYDHVLPIYDFGEIKVTNENTSNRRCDKTHRHTHYKLFVLVPYVAGIGTDNVGYIASCVCVCVCTFPTFDPVDTTYGH
jgi:hypothetical protein